MNHPQNDQQAYQNPSALPTRAIVSKTLLSILLLYLSWTLAWLLEQAIETHTELLATAGARFVYWTLMKIAIWISLALIIRFTPGQHIELCPSGQLRSALLWGLGVGLLIGAIATVRNLIIGQPLFSVTWGWALVNAVIVAPIIEEILFRGAVLPTLRQHLSFPIANTLTAMLFLGAHFPGWYFQGELVDNLTSLIHGALPVLLLGWVFGYIAYLSKSVLGSMLTHALNNLFSI
jgi:membrane protease YdiL (CAAX protease family)